MTILLASLALLIIFHEAILVITLLQYNQGQKSWFAIMGGVVMVSVAIVAILLKSWMFLALGFGLYRLTVMLDMGVSALRRDRNPSPLMPVNLLMAAGAGVASFAGWLWVFVVSYALFWLGSLLIGRRLMGSR